jgi:hypothetical protein
MISMLSLAKAPFIIHDVIATAAALTFIFRPQRQLQPLTPSATLILQCYGGCILFTNLISLIFLVRPVIDETTRLVALAFVFWHAWPSYRAIVRLQYGIETQGEMSTTLGGPVVHLGIHGLLFFMFMYTAFGTHE